MSVLLMLNWVSLKLYIFSFGKEGGSNYCRARLIHSSGWSFKSCIRGGKPAKKRLKIIKINLSLCCFSSLPFHQDSLLNGKLKLLSPKLPASFTNVEILDCGIMELMVHSCLDRLLACVIVWLRWTKDQLKKPKWHNNTNKLTDWGIRRQATPMFCYVKLLICQRSLGAMETAKMDSKTPVSCQKPLKNT